MQCELCLSRDDHPALGDEPWSTSVCSECAARPDVTRQLQDLWILQAVFETGGTVISDAAGVRYRYQRDHWEVSFKREMLEPAIRARSTEALYAELYRWHRDPEYALVPDLREWIKSAIDSTDWFRFEAFVDMGVDGIGVRYWYDGSQRGSPIGLRAQVAALARDRETFVQLVLESRDPFPGKNGLGWVSESVGGSYCGCTAAGELKFSILTPGASKFFEIPRSVVNDRDLASLQGAAGKV